MPIAGAQIIFPESGRGLGHMTATILAVRSASLATAGLLVFVPYRYYRILSYDLQQGVVQK